MVLICIHAAIQVDMLLQVILGEANIRSTATSSAQEDPLVRPPVPAPSHDAGLDQAAELASLRAELGAIKLDKEKQQTEIEALKLENKKLRTEVTVNAGAASLSDLVPLLFYLALPAIRRAR